VKTGALTGRTLGPYRLLELLGAGAIGVVYHGYHPQSKRHVAIKVLALPWSEHTHRDQERFALEAQTTASLQHPHIVPIYDYGSDQNGHYLVMRLLRGGTLEQRLKAFSGFVLHPSLGEVAQLLQQMASALLYAHYHHVIHRDVKPTNVMFDEHGIAFLVDFGVAKWVDTAHSLTETGILIGTPAFMAPEQWRGETQTPATDQYALGVLTYLLVSGRLPFQAERVHEFLYKHLNDKPPLIQTVCAGVPLSIDLIIQRALAKEPLERYPTVGAFAEAFASAAEHIESTSTNFFNFPLHPGAPLVQPAAYSGQAAPLPLPAYPAQRAVGGFNRRISASRLLIGGIAAASVLLGCSLMILLGSLAFFNDETMLDATRPAENSSPTAQILVSADVPTTVPALPTVATAFASLEILETEDFQQQAILRTDDTSTRSLALDPNGSWLVSGGNSMVVQFWDLESGAKGLSLLGHTGVIYALAFSPDGTELASASGDGTIRLWDSASGQLHYTLQGHSGEVRGIAFSPTGQQLASVGQDHTIRFWNTMTGQQVQIIQGEPDRILSVRFTADGTGLATGWMNNGIALWDVTSQAQKQVLVGHTDQIRAVALSPDNTLLGSASMDNTARLWNLKTGELQAVLQHTRPVLGVTFNPNGSIVATASEDAAIRLWNTETGEMVRTLTGHEGWIFDLEFNTGGNVLASAAGDGTIRLWGTSSPGQ
jgi:eukaryotic-like serine/threonine-protein kinase